MTDHPTKRFDEKEIIATNNALIHSRQTYSLIQQRILAFAMAKIERDDDGDQEYEVNISELTDVGTSENIYSKIDEESRNLTSKVISLRSTSASGKKKFTHYSVISKAEHEEGSGKLKIRFDPEVRDMLFRLDPRKGEFTLAIAVEKASCQSVYGAMIYHMLVSYWRFKEWTISVDELRYRLGVEDKYKNFSHFRTRVLEAAQSDVKSNTSLRFTWKELKQGKGKAVTHVKFKFTWKPEQLKLDFPVEKKEPVRTPKYKLWDRLLALGLKESSAEVIIGWLDDKPKQDWHVAVWLNENLEIPNPLDSAGNTIRSKENYLMKHFRDSFKKSGFPKPQNPEPNPSH